MAHQIIIDNAAIDQMVASLGLLQTAMNTLDAAYPEFERTLSEEAHEALEANETFLLGDLAGAKSTVDSFTSSLNAFL